LQEKDRVGGGIGHSNGPEASILKVRFIINCEKGIFAQSSGSKVEIFLEQ